MAAPFARICHGRWGAASPSTTTPTASRSPRRGLGAARAHRDGVVFGVIVATSASGGGVVIGGRVWQGVHGIAGEWGHHAVWAGAPDARSCYCGQRGCLEAYASGPAVEDDYARRSGTRAPLAEIAQRRRDGCARARGDRRAPRRLRVRPLSSPNVVDVLDPSAIVLGGGAVESRNALYTEGVARVARYVFNGELETPIFEHAVEDRPVCSARRCSLRRAGRVGDDAMLRLGAYLVLGGLIGCAGGAGSTRRSTSRPHRRRVAPPRGRPRGLAASATQSTPVAPDDDPAGPEGTRRDVAGSWRSFASPRPTKRRGSERSRTSSDAASSASFSAAPAPARAPPTARAATR